MTCVSRFHRPRFFLALLPSRMASEVSVKWCTSENNKWVALSENLRSGSQLELTFLFFISPSISWQFMSMSVPQSCPPTAANMLSFCHTIAHHVESQPEPASSLAQWLAGPVSLKREIVADCHLWHSLPLAPLINQLNS